MLRTVSDLPPTVTVAVLSMLLELPVVGVVPLPPLLLVGGVF